MRMNLEAIDVVCDGQRVRKSDTLAHVFVMKDGSVRRILMNQEKHLHDLVHVLKYDQDKIVVMLRVESQLNSPPVVVKHNPANFWSDLSPEMIRVQG